MLIYFCHGGFFKSNWCGKSDVKVCEEPFPPSVISPTNLQHFPPPPDWIHSFEFYLYPPHIQTDLSGAPRSGFGFLVVFKRRSSGDLSSWERWGSQRWPVPVAAARRVCRTRERDRQGQEPPSGFKMSFPGLFQGIGAFSTKRLRDFFLLSIWNVLPLTRLLPLDSWPAIMRCPFFTYRIADQEI